MPQTSALANAQRRSGGTSKDFLPGRRRGSEARANGRLDSTASLLKRVAGRRLTVLPGLATGAEGRICFYPLMGPAGVAVACDPASLCA